MTQKQPTQAKDNRIQSERFIETARALGCDEDEAAFEAKLRQIASYKPSPKAPKRKAKR